MVVNRDGIHYRTGSRAWVMESIDDAAETGALADGTSSGMHWAAKDFLDLGDECGEIDVVAVHFVDHDHRQPDLARFGKDAPGVDLNPGVGVDHDHCCFDGVQRGDRLADEVWIARGIDDDEPPALISK